jgi:predicted nucleic acid-binding Zn finger protein
MMTVRRIAGEPRRFYVSSAQGGELEYLVDLDEFAGNGWCSCKAFEFYHMPAMGDRSGVSRCKHLIGLRLLCAGGSHDGYRK